MIPLFSSLWVSQPAGIGFDYIVKLPPLPSHSFFIFGYKTFFGRFQSFLSIVVQQLVVIVGALLRGGEFKVHSTLPTCLQPFQ